ncbi:hypothetical protein [Bacillus sp. FSL K6-3458]|uniref:hypothetical protein n=1 Tax=Bacillus sp. FSL K6-3458 TaxID=2921501 RepID=UPI0030FA5E1D
MNVLEFISSIINTIIWPIFIFVAILILKTPIAELIKNIARIKYGSFELELIDKKLSEVTINSVQSNADVSLDYQSPVINEFNIIREQISSLGPRVAVVTAFRVVKSRMYDLCVKHDISSKNNRNAIDILYDLKIIDLNIRDSYKNLNELFYILSNYDQISESQANKFIDASELLAINLDKLSERR